MIDKILVKKRFEKNFITYDDNAFVQKLMAKKLVNFIDRVNYDSIFEIGSATGILTKEIKDKYTFNKYTANDIVEGSEKYIEKIIPQSKFITGDIEMINLTESYDLIISNACLQWCNDINLTIMKLYNVLKENGILAISIFGDENLKEIKKIFEIENSKYTMQELQLYLSKYHIIKFVEEKNEYYFENLKTVLKHLKYTGVNAIKEIKLTKNKLNEYEKLYNSMYSKNGQLCLTYNPLYIIIQKLPE